jgi:hypothetical protein
MSIRVNEQIESETVLLYGEQGALEAVSLDEALKRARSRGMDLVTEWEAKPLRQSSSPPVCLLLPLRKPVVWERAGREPLPIAPEFDPLLWFETESCPERHFVLVANPHTFPGRFTAWCPTKRISYRGSKSDITVCSREVEYFLKGLLAGQEPDAPTDEEGDLLPPSAPDYLAWVNATSHFQQTGYWNERFRVCASCGARLLPSNPNDACEGAHLE